MDERQVADILAELGWQIGMDEAGDYFGMFDVDGRQVHVVPSVGRRIDHFRFSLQASASVPGFSRAVSVILGRQEGFSPIVVDKRGPEKLGSLTRDDVVRFSEAAISWAKAQDIESGLHAYRDLPPDAKGMRPLWHLAALALARDVAQLDMYQRAFHRGERLGFVPYISTEMIDRALVLARSGT